MSRPVERKERPLGSGRGAFIASKEDPPVLIMSVADIGGPLCL